MANMRYVKMRKACFLFMLCIAVSCGSFLWLSINFFHEYATNNRLTTLLTNTRVMSGDSGTCQTVLLPTSDMRDGRGLGNTMWLYASAYGIAKHNGMKLLLRKAFDIPSNIFKLDVLPNVYDNDGIRFINWTVVSDIDFVEPCCDWMLFKESLYDFTKHNGCRNLKLIGYYQSWRYFTDYEADIRRQFIFSTKVHRKVQVFLRNVTLDWRAAKRSVSNETSRPVYVGVHVRLGDWNYDNVTYLREYLLDAMSHFVQIYPNTMFVVCSNNIHWCRSNLQAMSRLNVNYTVVFSPFIDRLLDMALLSSCNHSIITAGTFGWWAAYLAGGTTLYYSRTPLKIGYHLWTTNTSHFYYPTWIPF